MSMLPEFYVGSGPVKKYGNLVYKDTIRRWMGIDYLSNNSVFGL